MIRVVMAESNPDKMQHIEQLITDSGEIVLSQKADDPDSFKAILDSSDWQICLLSLSYPFELIKDLLVSLNLANPDGKVILLSDDGDKEQILDLLSLGAPGFLDYSDADRFIIKAIGKVWEGEAWIPRSMVALILDRLTWLNSFSGTSKGDCTKVQ
jgi:DNA-binding NarL/FixJ family response regulator